MQRDIQVYDEIEEASPSSLAPKKGGGFSSLLRTAQRKALLIVGITGIVTALVWRYGGEEMPVTYTGTFQILVEPVTSQDQLADPLILTRGGGEPSDSLFRLDYPTQLEILKSPGILNSIVQQVQTEFPGFTLKKLQSNLVVERIIGANKRFDATKILQVRYQDENPKKTLFITQKIADKYLKYSLDERKSQISEGVKFINQQLPQLQEQVNYYRAKIQQIQQEYGLIDPQARGESLFTQIQDLENQQMTTQRELSELQTVYRTLQNQLELTPDEALAASALSENPTRTQLLAKLSEIESQIATQSAVFSPSSAEMQLLQQQRQNLVQLLDQETQKVLGENSSDVGGNDSVFTYQTSLRQQLISQLVTTQNQIQALEVRLQGLNSAQNTVNQKAQLYPQITRQYTELQQQLQLTSTTLNQFLSEREKLRIEAAQDNIPWEIISKPQVPMDATGQFIPDPGEDPKKKLIMGLGGGLILGLGLALLIERLRNIFYTLKDLQETVQLPILGVIPRQENQRLPNLLKLSGWGETSAISDRSSRFADAFDSLYANLRFIYSDTALRSIAVCSAEPGDGKSTVAVNLAQTVAQMGRRVLLVDANLRQPNLHRVLGVANQNGLSNLLTEDLSAKTLIQRSHLSENLFILTAGVPRPKAFKLLASAKMQCLVEDLQTHFDLVIYDTPALARCTDATFLSESLDGLILVVAIARTHRTVFEKILEQFNTYRMPCLGIVANSPKSSPSVPHQPPKPTSTSLITIREGVGTREENGLGQRAEGKEGVRG